ncbi:MAG: hypothetical protein K8S98_14165 [Planctomycetes bacterium]|nr:hypothetical protein [Planctomycetota bacterium]
MSVRRYAWREGGSEHELVVVRVPGTNGAPFELGASSHHKPVEVPDFWIGATQVTRALWQHVHCTVSWRYGSEPDAHDGCIGLRLALA